MIRRKSGPVAGPPNTAGLRNRRRPRAVKSEALPHRQKTVVTNLVQSGPTPRAGDALLVVDVQNDFLPGGALAVPDGDAVLPVLNRWLDRFAQARLPVYATRDWHPASHCSFRLRGGPWPVHCVAGSDGAAFASGLALPANAQVVSKGCDPDLEAYSGFSGTDLAQQLRAAGVRRLVVWRAGDGLLRAEHGPGRLAAWFRGRGAEGRDPGGRGTWGRR